MEAVKARKKDVSWLTGTAFPDYRGRKFWIESARRVPLYNTNWDGGTRNEYAVVEMETGRMRAVRVGAPWANIIEGNSMEMRPGFALVQRAVFQGVEMGLRVYVHPDNLARLLPREVA